MQQFIDSIISNFVRSLSQLYSSPFSRVDPWIIWLIIISRIAFITISIIWVIRAHHKPVSTGSEDLVGSIAVVDTALNPQGLALVKGERWQAILDKGSAEPEEKAIITKVVGLKLMVIKGETT